MAQSKAISQDPSSVEVCQTCLMEQDSCTCKNGPRWTKLVNKDILEALRSLKEKGYEPDFIDIGNSPSKMPFLHVRHPLPITGADGMPHGFSLGNCRRVLNGICSGEQPFEVERSQRIDEVTAWCKALPNWEDTEAARRGEYTPTLQGEWPEPSDISVDRLFEERLPQDLLDIYEQAKDKSEVIESIAADIRLPFAVAERLAQALKEGDEAYLGAECGLARNPHTPGYVLEYIAVNDSYGEASEYVIANPATPAAVVKWLAHTLPGLELEYMPLPAGIICELVDEGCFELLANPEIPLAYLERYAEDPDTKVREIVASNPVAPLSLLERLAADCDDFYVYQNACLNPNASEQMRQAYRVSVEELESRLNIVGRLNLGS